MRLNGSGGGKSNLRIIIHFENLKTTMMMGSLRKLAVVVVIVAGLGNATWN